MSMKTQTVTINKTADRPEGVEVELVTPESELEQKVLAHLLGGFMRDARSQGRVDDALPDDVRYEYTRHGSFVAMGTPADAPSDGMYVPRQPLAIAGIARFGDRFDVIHGSLAGRPAAAGEGGGEADRGAAGSPEDEEAAPEETPEESMSDAMSLRSANPPEAEGGGEAGDDQASGERAGG